MKFKLDENLPQVAVQPLIARGFDAETVAFEKLVGIGDRALLDLCFKEKRCLITLDKDFADANKYPPAKYHGIILLRVNSQGKTMVLELLERVIPVLEYENPVGKIWLVNSENIKILDNI